MTDNVNNTKQREIDDFFSQFDKISSDFNKSTSEPSTEQTIVFDNGKLYDAEAAVKADHENREKNRKSKKTRMERLSEDKTKGSNAPFSKLCAIGTAVSESVIKGSDFVKGKFLIENTEEGFETGDGGDGGAGTGIMGTKAKRKKHKKYRLNVKKLVKFIVGIGLVCCLALGIFTLTVIARATEIHPDSIYSELTEASVLYDDEGNVIDSVFVKAGNRTNISYDDLPDNLVNAFVAIEDKTFWDHNGFNIIRIFGAIKESIFDGGKISGTSTITQQLARNVYLAEEMSDRTLTRKIAEAYYTIILEKELTKEQILEAYVNTIYLGYNAYGVQTAAQNYFSKDIADLDLLECAALASLAQAPDAFALIKQYNSEDVTEDTLNIIHRAADYTYVYNGDISKNRRELTLKNMNDQGYITEEEKSTCLADDLALHMNPSEDTFTTASSYFNDYVISQVVSDMMAESNITYEEAQQKLYSGGLRIHTTMSSKAQAIVEKEFSSNTNFPSVVNLKKDTAGNILNENGNILLFAYSNIFDTDGIFTIPSSEYKAGSDGSVILLKSKRLNFYKTTVQGETDYSVEFKKMFLIEDNVFYSIGGGVLAIPQKYKTRDDDGNLIISKQFFDDYPDFFQFDSDGISISNKCYTLEQRVVQPQSAMVITDVKTGGIKAMVGGRNTVGRLLHNRAVKPRPPGSSIKPISVYGPALQSAGDALNGGTTQTFSLANHQYGDYWTAASIIDDAPMTFQGKQWPKNWYSGFRGLKTFRYSVEYSINVNSVKVFQQVGDKYSINFLKKLGVTTVVESGDTNDLNAAALALGGMTYGISPLEMAAAYGTFANQGKYIEPAAYIRVTNKRGEIILEKTSRQEQVMDPGAAFIMTDILRTTVSNGIAGAAAIGTQPVAGKTGTTSDNFDAWFVGLTPQYAASLWIGNDVNIELSQGSGSATKLWSKIMKQVCAGLQAGSFPSAPSNVISVSIDTTSGLLPSEFSALAESVRSEYFISGTQPKTVDTSHTYVNVCTESGYLATPYCPSSTAKFGVKRLSAPSGSVSDTDELPYYYCNLHNLNPALYAIDPNTGGVDPNFVWDGVMRDPNNTPGTTSSSGGAVTDSSQPSNPDGGTNDTTPPPDNQGNTEDSQSTMPSWVNQ